MATKGPHPVERRDGSYYVSGSRVSLASIVYEHRDGSPVETIGQNFPTLSITQINGAIEFYLANRAEVESYLRDRKEAGKPSRNRLHPYPRHFSG